MLVFVDESGDPGMKFQEGSSHLFIVTLVVFNDHDEAQATDDRIRLLRRELGVSEAFEFKFNKMNRAFRTAFLEAVCGFDFFYFGIVLNKALLHGPGFQFKQSFYKYTCSLVFENAKPHLSDATVVIDGSGSREFRQQLDTYLRRKINDKNAAVRHIRKVKVQDSHRNNLLQLADVVCGTIARSYSGKQDSKVYRPLISHREITVQVWPR
jgi:hypothetical protein